MLYIYPISRHLGLVSNSEMNLNILNADLFYLGLCLALLLVWFLPGVFLLDLKEPHALPLSLLYGPSSSP